MKNLSKDTPDHDPQADQALYDLMTKSAAGGTEVETNEDESTTGTTPDPDDIDEDRPSGNIDAPWGEKPSPEVVQFSRQAFTEFKQDREGLLKRYFDTKAVGGKADQALVAQQLSHGASGDYETSSPQLSEQAKKAIGG